MVHALKDKKIAVLYGGLSAERKISLKTGAAVVDSLAAAGYTVTGIDANRQVMQALRATQPDVVFVALHGRLGEDGTIQGVLEYMDIPYTGSGVLGSALAMDKLRSKQLFAANGLPTPPFIAVTADDPAPTPDSWPVVVKPVQEGSSIGLTIVGEPAGLPAALASAFAYDPVVLCEKYIAGRELTVGVLGNREPQTLPVIEIVPDNDFFDFEAKYTKGKTEYLVPAELPACVTEEAERLARAAYRALQCRGMGRVDMLLDDKRGLHVLEVNTIPGMTETSLLPMAARAAGIPFLALLERIVQSALPE